MVLISLVSIAVALISTLIVVKLLYRFSFKKADVYSMKEHIINGIIIALVFFCVSSFVYVILLNII